MKHQLSTAGKKIKTILGQPLEAAWTIAVVAALATLLLSGVGLLVGELTEVSDSNRTPPTEQNRPAVRIATINDTGDAFRVEVEGDPGTRVVLAEDSGLTTILTLDKEGRGMVDLARPRSSTLRVEASAIPEEPDLVAERIIVIPPTPRPTPTSLPIAARLTRIPTPTPAPTSTAPPVVRRTDLFPSPTATVIPRSTPPPTIPPIKIATRDQLITAHDREQTPTPENEDTPAVAPGNRAKTKNQSSKTTPPVLHLVIDAGPRIALTFDGGASSNHTADLLDLLRELDIKATLFLTGQFIEKQPALVRRALLEGHEIGNHTFSHPHLTSYEQDQRHRTLPEVTRESLQRELRRTEETFRRATGRAMEPLWRAPFGEENAALRRWAFEIGYLHIRWSSLEGRSLDTLDWINDEHNSLYRDSKRIMNNLLAFPRLEGGIVLMHLATDRDEMPWAHLPEFVAALRKRNIEQVKITDMLEQSKIWDGWLHRAAEIHAATME